jgi:hypothetical protein
MALEQSAGYINTASDLMLYKINNTSSVFSLSKVILGEWFFGDSPLPLSWNLSQWSNHRYIRYYQQYYVRLIFIDKNSLCRLAKVSPCIIFTVPLHKVTKAGGLSPRLIHACLAVSYTSYFTDNRLPHNV